MDNFWEVKDLNDLSQEEWEALCDRCGLCCLLRAEDEETGEVYITNVICSSYDCLNRKCRNYEIRNSINADCISLTVKNIKEFDWLPETCAYRLLYQKKMLPKSHPLRSKCFSKTKTVVDVFSMKGLIPEGPGINIAEHIIYNDVSEITYPLL